MLVPSNHSSPIFISVDQISPHIRFVNNYAPAWAYTEGMRIIYDYELIFVAEGYCDLYCDGQTFHLEKSDVFLLRPFVNNQLTVFADSGLRIHCIHFDWIAPEPKYDFTAEEMYIPPFTNEDIMSKKKLLSTRPNYVPDPLPFTGLLKKVSPKLEELFSSCYYTYIQTSEVSKLQLKALFFSILSELYLCSNTKIQETSALLHPVVKKCITHIRNHYKENITIHNLALEYNLSEKYLGTIFKNAIGKSVHEFLLETRLTMSKMLIQTTDMPISIIAEEVGFSNIYYFSCCFKEAFQMTPTEFRRT